MAPVLGTKGNVVSCEDMRNCFYGAYLDSSKGPDDRQYSPVTDVPALISTMEGYLVDHNGMNTDPAACTASVAYIHVHAYVFQKTILYLRQFI